MREFLSATWPPITVGILGAFGTVSMSPLWSFLVIMMFFDARTRWIDYKRLKKILDRIGPSEIYLENRCASWCQRTSTIAAYKACGYEHFAVDYYNSKGYRFWHIFPDKTFSLKCPLIDWKFWETMINRKNYYN